jgi:hypothetical protein
VPPPRSSQPLAIRRRPISFRIRCMLRAGRVISTRSISREAYDGRGSRCTHQCHPDGVALSHNRSRASQCLVVLCAFVGSTERTSDQSCFGMLGPDARKLLLDNPPGSHRPDSHQRAFGNLDTTVVRPRPLSVCAGLGSDPLDRFDLGRMAMNHRRQAGRSHSLRHLQSEDRKGLARVSSHERRPNDDRVVGVQVEPPISQTGASDTPAPAWPSQGGRGA